LGRHPSTLVPRPSVVWRPWRHQHTAEVGLTIRIFFASDIHGSERCFLKFINAGQFYKVNVLIMGGDMTGKAIVPIVATGNGRYRCTFVGKAYDIANETELADLEKLIRINGFYPFRSDPDEVARLSSDSEYRDAKFMTLMRDTLRHWISIAEERLKGKGIRVFMTPGNDDHLEIDDVLEGSDIVTNPESKLVHVADGSTDREMISSGWAGPTPFDTPRECSEEDLDARLRAMAVQLTKPATAIFNFHDPPFDSHLDYAPVLDKNMRVQSEGGQARMVPVGSPSVRRLIEEYQPQLALHGHIHESRGQVKIGQTMCINPGSEYAEGILRGALIELDKDKLKNAQLVSG
jgi:Icc-related predicted phosphoesterase